MMDDKIKKMIEENPMALATIDKSGNPYCIAIADVKIVSEDKILIGDNYMKITLENINQNKNVCLVVWDNNMEGYQFVGEAEYFKEGEWVDKVKEIHKGYPAKGAIFVKINDIKKLV